jgi:hypothetical protein
MRAAAMLFLVSLAGCTAADERLDPVVVELVNGKDLSPFYSYLAEFGRDHDPDAVFSIRDGNLRVSGQHWGYLNTRQQFEDYRLLIEFRWGEKTWSPREARARDSGILLHSFGEDGAADGNWMQSLEVQLIEGGTGDFIIISAGEELSMTVETAAEMQGESYVFLEGGREVTVDSGRVNWWGRDPHWADVTGFRGAHDVENARGEWNELDILANGDRLTVRLNTVLVNRATRVRPRRGSIQIQSEGAELFIRKMDVHPLK